MDLHRHPELLDQLAGKYALGALRGGARRRFEALCRDYAPVRAAALVWEARFHGLTELGPAVTPDPAVWRRIDNLVNAAAAASRQQAQARPSRAPSPSGWAAWLSSLGVWRLTAAASLVAGVLGAVVGVRQVTLLRSEVSGLQAQLATSERIKYVAVLQDAKSNAEVLVTFDPRANTLTLQRVGGYRESPDRSLQLWALQPGQKPRSLGVLGRESLLKLTASDRDVERTVQLAISLEAQGGVDGTAGPGGPVMFTGALIKKQL